MSNIGRLIVVVGGQFGSEAKGHLAAQLSTGMRPGSLVIRTGGPNAGHTVWKDDTEYKLRHLPTPIAMRDDLHMALAARSVVDPNVLRAEMAMFPGRSVYVDPSATILEPGHIEAEKNDPTMVGIGSTRKGIGAARADRIARVARTARDLWGDYGTAVEWDVVGNVEVGDLARSTLLQGRDVLVEAAQGYGLGLHTKFYPTVTSADCTAIDALADARISPWGIGNDGGVAPEVWMAIRPFPIRVAGNSGPLEGETTWGALGLPEERTTVTNKVRRVGTWDPQLVFDAVLANGGPGTVRVALMMADQVVPEVAGMTKLSQVEELPRDAGQNLGAWLDRVATSTGCEVEAVGTGPRTMIFRDED